MSVCTPSLDLMRPDRRRGVSAALSLLVVLGIVLIGPGTARAHTGFESSTPSEADVVDEPVGLVTIRFTGEAKPVGDGFVALTAAGVVQEPVGVETLDDKLFSIRFDPPLAGGQIGVRWNVQAADAHPIEGSFSFSVTAPSPTTAAPTTIPATTIEPAASSVDSRTDSSVAVEPDGEPTAAEPDGERVAVAAEAAATPPQSLDEFLAVDNSAPGQTAATVGRLIGFLGVVLGLGAFAFVASVLRGRRDEVRHVLTAVRVSGLVIAIGAAIEYVGVARIGGDSLVSEWSSGPGFAAVLRVLGGIGLAAGVAGTISATRGPRAVNRPPVARSLSAAVVDDMRTEDPRATEDAPIVRWTPDARSWPAFCGVVLVIVSFWFDGHTVSKGFRPLHALVNSVHVAAGAVWVGGVVTMAAIIWNRYRSGHRMRVVELVVRFSKIATVALAAVVVAGAIMAFLVLDSFGELTGTPWGRILLLKTAAVGLAIVGGAYNHFRLLPALDADPESPELLGELRATVTAEAIMLVFVVTVTAWLVAAAS